MADNVPSGSPSLRATFSRMRACSSISSFESCGTRRSCARRRGLHAGPDSISIKRTDKNVNKRKRPSQMTPKNTRGHPHPDHLRSSPSPRSRNIVEAATADPGPTTGTRRPPGHASARWRQTEMTGIVTLLFQLLRTLCSQRAGVNTHQEPWPEPPWRKQARTPSASSSWRRRGR